MTSRIYDSWEDDIPVRLTDENGLETTVIHERNTLNVNSFSVKKSVASQVPIWPRGVEFDPQRYYEVDNPRRDNVPVLHEDFNRDEPYYDHEFEVYEDNDRVHA